MGNFTDPAYFETPYEQRLNSATGPLSTTNSSSSILSCSPIDCGLKAPYKFEDISPGLQAQYKILSKYFNTEAITRILNVSGGMSPQFVNETTKLFTTSLAENFFPLLGILEHPYPRASIHIKSSNPAKYL
ncbi:hypothetical protein DL98DRAFT_304713 [Cadophora sp. DSE1049]|nr:hypothetical protein DL98DRAFT_304713 [Cadophora sp. DSE1049]